MLTRLCRRVTFHERTLYTRVGWQQAQRKGYAAVEIAEAITLPGSLARQWHTRDYYGSVKTRAAARSSAR